MVLNESQLSHKAATNVLPLQDAFAVLFFVSVGMLFDPTILAREPLMILGVVALILIGKSLVALGIVLAMRYPLSTALTVASSLAQIGEFSFILAGLGQAHGLLTKEGLNLVLAGALISITLNQFVFALNDRVCRWVTTTTRIRARFETANAAQFAQLQADLDNARRVAQEKAAAHKTFTPEELVERFPLFAGLTPEQREVVVLHFHPEKAEPGHRIIRKGDKADAVYFISSGECEVTVPGKRIKLHPGDFFGEMGLLNDQPRSADVTALDFSELLALSQRDFRQFLRRFPAIREQVMTLAAQRGQMNQQFLRECQEAARAETEPEAEVALETR
jgi:CPA2 family monovalent cation:H+ antiporter-2